MTAPVFGIINNRPEYEVLPVLGADFSKIGIVTTSADANGTLFPTQTAVRFSSTDSVYATAAALGTGLLADAISGINEQIGLMGASADVIAVRVAVGATEADTIQNVVNGLAVLRDSPASVNATPRIIICPGFTMQTTSVGGSIDVSSAAKQGGNTGGGDLTLAGTPNLSGIKSGVYHVRINGGQRTGTGAAKLGGNTGNGTIGSITCDPTSPLGAWRVICGVAEADGGTFSVLKPDGTLDGLAVVGTAYNSTNGPTFTISDGSADFIVGDEFVVTVVDSVPTDGGTFTVQDPEGVYLTPGTVGTPYASQIAFTVADGTPDFIVGDGWDVTVVITDATIEANPVVAALPDVCETLLAVAFVDAPDSSLNAAENWRETVQSDRIIPVGVSVRVYENAVAVTRPASPRIAGLCVRIDNAHSGQPFHPIANRPIYGIIGTNRNIPFSLTDGATEGQLMLAADIGVIVRGELGVDAAIADAGFVYVGTESCAEGDLWAQFHQVRGSDYITVKLMKLTRQFLGKLVNADMAEAWLNSIKFMLRDHKAANDILGYKVVFSPDLNSPEQVRLGRLTVTPMIEEAPSFRVATHQIMRYRPAVDQLVRDIIARLNAA